MEIAIVSLPSYKCPQQLQYSPVAVLCHITSSKCFWKTFTLSIIMKLIRITNLLKLDQLLILSVISALKLNWRITTAWRNKLYHLKQNFQVYSNIIQEILKNGALRTCPMLGLLESCMIFSFIKEDQQQIMKMTTLIMNICKTQHKLLQSYVRIFLAIKKP